MSLTARIQKAAALQRNFGTRYLARFLFRRLVFSRVRRVVYDFDLGAPLEEPRWNESEAIEVYGPHNYGDIPDPLRFALGGDLALEYLRGLEKGDLLFTVRSGEQYLHWSFVLMKTRQSKHLRLPPNVPIIGNCNTIAEARGRRLYPRVLRAALRKLAGMGFRRVAIETALDNIPSQRGIERAGFRLMYRMSGVVLFNTLAVQRIEHEKHAGWRMWLV